MDYAEEERMFMRLCEMKKSKFLENQFSNMLIYNLRNIPYMPLKYEKCR